MREDLVSIIVPVYNVEEYIGDCLDSLIKQKYRNIEIIVIIDGSEDDSEKIVDEYIKKNENIIKFTQSNSGLSSARNSGMSEASGEFIMFVDSDDILYENAVELLVDRQKETESDIVCANIKREYKSRKWQNYFFKNEIIKNDILFDPVKNSKYIININNSVCAKLFKRELIDYSGIIFKEGYHYEDLLFTFSLIPYCKKIYLLKDFIYEYRVHDNSIMDSASKLDNIVKVSKTLLDYYKEKKVLDIYYHELWHIIIKHSFIGGTYRGFKHSFKEYKYLLKLNKELLDANNIEIRDNRYFKDYNVLYRIYLTFMSLIL